MPSCWSYTVGERPHTVIVYERTPDGVLWARCWDASVNGGRRRVSLGHRDKVRAKAWARGQAVKLEHGEDGVPRKVTVAQVLKAYVSYLEKKPKRTAETRAADRRREELWIRLLGAKQDAHRISLGQWQDFINKRTSGELDARGREVPEDQRRPVRNRIIEKDLRWLRWALSWATKYRTSDGRYLMRESPVRGVEFSIPKEPNPARPVATQERFEAMRGVSDEHQMDVRWNGHRTAVCSYMSELLDLIDETGHRIGAVRQLRYCDLRLERTQTAPYGAIVWSEKADKQDHEHEVPVSSVARSALDRIMRDRPGVGEAYLFPSPTDSTEPVSKRLVQRWFDEVEKAAKLEPVFRGKWHAFRRKWATERKHLPDVAVAHAGGWKSVETMKACYQQADEVGVLIAVLDRKELRQVR